MFHKSLIFDVTEKIIKENNHTLEKKQAIEWIEISSNEIIQNKV